MNGPPGERGAVCIVLAAMILLGSFFVGGAALAWRHADPLTFPAMPVLKAVTVMADLGWRFWGR